MASWQKVVTAIAVAVGLLSVGYLLSGRAVPSALLAHGGWAGPIALVAGGFFAGVGVTVFVYARSSRHPLLTWIYISLFCAAIMAIAAVQSDHLSFGQALLVVILGSMALAAAGAALVRFHNGENIELESNWGGLGGGLGGWRVSAVTCLSVLAVIFAASAVVASRVAPPKPVQAAGVPPQTTPKPTP